MTTSTERLRKLLDERGVEHEDYAYVIPETQERCEVTRIKDYAGRFKARFMSCNTPGKVDIAVRLTPEQAIAVTLGSMSATVDDVLSLLDEINEQGHIEYADYSQIHDAITAMLGSEECEQAIAATLGNGTCEFTLEYDRDEVERRKQMYEAEPFGLFPQDMPDSAWTCSNCGQQFKCHCDRQTGHVLPIPDWMKHCPNCGRKVMSK